MPIIDPALAEALTVTGLLTLGGIVPLPRVVVCIGAGAALGWSAMLPAMLGSTVGAALGFLLARSSSPTSSDAFWPAGRAWNS